MCKMSGYLQLVLIENAQQIVRYDRVETLQKTVHLILDAVAQTLLGQRVQILILGGIGDADLGTVGNQFDGLA